MAALLALLLLGAALGLSACGQAQPETPATAMSFLKNLSDLDLAEQQKLFWDYCGYRVQEESKFLNHAEELRFLPEFTDVDAISWDEASRFLLNFAPGFTDPEGYVCWPEDAMLQAANILLPGYAMPAESSVWVTYEEDEGYYRSTGWDNNGAVYYRLSAPITEEDGLYTADLLGYALDELWFEAGDFGPAVSNEAALCRIAQARGVSPYDFDLAAELPAVIDAGDLMPCECLRITFRLSGDAELPLMYESAARYELASN